ncbi:hypothetical protein L218DRAFT_959864 [Marasmius fiardii PR-910]|nr:hypothetical protein L218DRAFT_959864 [Marasmius fiardii PR-910]
MAVIQFKWIFGLDCGFPFDNLMSASKDILECLEIRTLVFFPTTKVLEMFMMLKNDSPLCEPRQRKRSEVNGNIFFYRCWNPRRASSYQHYTNAHSTFTPFNDFEDYDALPRFACLPPNNHPSEDIQEKPIVPVKNMNILYPYQMPSSSARQTT